MQKEKEAFVANHGGNPVKQLIFFLKKANNEAIFESGDIGDDDE